ncbi:MAG TPA: NBR1-Ig-like domain-containing protein, partial [Ktedonobacteraceae bacterium]|nr:NBR1-Ig-like domain-containing protein [Ktedonobacteraceae bacterium]
SDAMPAQMVPGGSATIQLTLQNTGNFPWKANGQRAVQLVYRWLDSQKHILSTSEPISLTGDLAIKGTQKLSVVVQAPSQAGKYTLQWDLLQAKQSFSKLGAKLRNDPIEVGEPASPVS